MIYNSRTSQIEQVIPRQEPVVYGQGNRYDILSEEELRFFAENGYLIKPGLLSNEVEALVKDIPNLTSRLSGCPEIVLEPESNEVRSIFSPDLFSDLYKQLSEHEQLKKASEQILDSDVYIHHSRVNIKAGLSGKSFPWHSDFETWHTEDGIPAMRIVTGWVFLNENNEFNGPLLVIPQSHKHFINCVGETPQDNYQTSLRKQVVGVPSKAILSEMVTRYGLKAIYGPPGTVVFHECNLLHGSSDNMTPYPRANVFFVYNSTENQPQKWAATRPEFLARQYCGKSR